MLMEPAWSDMLTMDTDRLDIFANWVLVSARETRVPGVIISLP